MSWQQGDLWPPVSVQLINGDPVTGTAVPLTGATSATLKMRAVGGSLLTFPMSIADTAHGIVNYAWQSGNTDLPGVYKCYVVITWASGIRQTFPQVQQDFFTIVIEPAL